MFNKKNKIIVKIDGMNCEHCAKKIENVLNKLDGVNKVKVDLKNKEAIIISKNDISNKLVTDTIEQLNYKVISILK